MSDWEGGQRQGIRWRRIGVAIAVVGLVGAGAYVVRHRGQIAVEIDGPPIGEVSETVDVVVTAPLSAGDRWYCPSTHPIAAYDSGEYVPPHFPVQRTQQERPADCFADPGRAEGAGYSLADAPDDVVLAGGIYLEPTRAPTAQACANLAGNVGFAVPCPTRLPTPSFGPTCVGSSCMLTAGSGEGVVIEHRAFEVPAEWPNDGTPQVFVTAAEIQRERADGTLQVRGDPALVACHRDDPVAATSRARFVNCAPGQTWIPHIQGEPHESHTAAFWRDDSVVYAASVEGHGQAAQELLHALIDGIEYVAP